MSSVAIIPARGGSKRLPRKNIRPFCGKPMISYSIEAARKSGLFDRIVVSTDSDEIAEVAQASGAEVPFRRPPELADDHATTSVVLIHALESLRATGYVPEYLCLIYAGPFVQPRYLRQGFEDLRAAHASSACAVTTYAYPIYRAFRLNATGRLDWLWPEYRQTRSQDLPDVCHAAGQFYWADAEVYRREKTFLTADTLPVMLPRYLVQDIDTEEDWDLAESMYRVLLERGLIA